MKDTERAGQFNIENRNTDRVTTLALSGSGSGHSEFLYEKLAKELEEKIKTGVFLAGEKLPSIRELKKQLNLSVSTVYQAYILLEEWDLLEARPKSGYFVKAMGASDFQVPETKAVDPNPQVVTLDKMVPKIVGSISNRELLPLGGASIDPDMLPVKQFSKAMKSISSDRMKAMVNYGVPEGNIELRREISKRYTGKASINPEQVIITNGCMEALTLCLLALTKAGDTIAIETPAHFGILQLLEELGLRIAEIPTHPEQGMDLKALEEVLDNNVITACLFTPDFHNPLGTRMSDQQKQELVKITNKRSVPVIEDSIYSELYYGKESPKPLRYFDQSDLVLSCSSFSKTLSAGYRIGWAIPGKRYLEKVTKLKVGFSISTANIEQTILTSFLQSGAYERHLRFLRSSFKKNVTKTTYAIRQFFPENTRISKPKGGFLLWVELPEDVEGLELYYAALKEKIAIVPGIVCANSKIFTHHIRISCGIAFSVEVRKGIQRLGELVYEIQRKKYPTSPELHQLSGRFKLKEIQKLIPDYSKYKQEYIPLEASVKQLQMQEEAIHIEITFNPADADAVKLAAQATRFLEMAPSQLISSSYRLNNLSTEESCRIEVFKSQVLAGVITNKPVKTLEQDLVYLTS